MMFYRIIGIYIDALFKNDTKKANEIREDMVKYGYKDFITSWPK